MMAKSKRLSSDSRNGVNPKTPKKKRRQSSVTPSTPAEVEARIREIRRLSMEGLTVQEIAERVGVTRKRVYAHLRRGNYPTNPTIYPYSDDENAIARAIATGWSLEEVARHFSHAPASIRAILERIARAPIPPASSRFQINDPPSSE